MKGEDVFALAINTGQLFRSLMSKLTAAQLSIHMSQDSP